MLNEMLYRRLMAAYGSVTVVNEDVELEGEYRRAADKEWRGTGVILDDVIESGEEFRVSCPECSDTRKRLYINHMWGVVDSRTGTRHLWAMQCFNCHVEHDYVARKKIEDAVYGNLLATVGAIRLNSPPPGKTNRRGPVTLPGVHWKLDQIARHNPDHEAVQYLDNRFYSAEYLGRKFDVGFCPESTLRWARRRIVAPVYFDGKLVSWTARFLGEPPDNSIPKWAHASVNIGRYIYNLDRMIRHNTIVLVEGPGDVWSFGIQAGGLFGKIIRRPQIKLLKSQIRPGTVIVVMLDPDISPDDLKAGREHHIERTFNELNRVREFNGRVLKVYLPRGRDPGDLDRWYMRDYIRWRARKEGIPVEFGKRARAKRRVPVP